MPWKPTSDQLHLQPAKVVMGAQLRAGRAILGWTKQTLATTACIHKNSVARWERAQTLPAALLREPYGVRRMREALEGAGVSDSSHDLRRACGCAEATVMSCARPLASGRCMGSYGFRDFCATAQLRPPAKELMARRVCAALARAQVAGVGAGR